MNLISLNDSYAVFGKDEYAYQCVLDDFHNSSFIGIVTFNISQNSDSYLLQSLRSACQSGANAVIVTNIPTKYQSLPRSKKVTNSYIQQLDPQYYSMKLAPYFSSKNHAKIVMTDNIVYWGSSNYSDWSTDNFECGTISTDKNLIDYLKNTFFPDIIRKSIPYYEYNFAKAIATDAIANLNKLILIFQETRQELIDASFEPIKEKWVYRTTDSGLTTSFLQGFVDTFSHFDGALDIIDDILDEYSDCVVLPSGVKRLKDLYEDYKRTYDSFLATISSLFWSLEQVARYNPTNIANRILEENYSLEACEEDLNYYAEQAAIEAADKYSELIMNTEPMVLDAGQKIASMIKYLNQLRDSLEDFLKPNPKIDNTFIEQN